MNIEKIEINGHYVWVDKDAEVEERDWYYDDTKKIRKAVMGDGLYWAVRNGYLKIIATSPELNLEGVPTYVEWLARNYSEEKTYTDFDEGKRIGGFLGFIKGYQTRDKELPTWDDVRKAIDLARFGGKITNYYSEEEIIEQLKQEKP